MLAMTDQEYSEELLKHKLSAQEYNILLEELKKRAVLYYFEVNKDKPKFGPERVGFNVVAEHFGLTRDQLRGAIRKYGPKINS